jgi:hypothetical protein
MEPYHTKSKKFAGTSWADVNKKAFTLYKQIKAKTKRRPYIKSAYFKKDKIFLGIYWSHLHEKKNLKDKTRRVKFFGCAVELIKNSTFKPASKENPNNKDEIIHRFAGLTADNELFFVQIKEEKRTGKKWLISTFPPDK